MNHIPESPHIAGVKDVEGLAGMVLAVLHIRTKQVVVGTGIPLKKKERVVRTFQKCLVKTKCMF